MQRQSKSAVGNDNFDANHDRNCRSDITSTLDRPALDSKQWRKGMKSLEKHNGKGQSKPQDGVYFDDSEIGFVFEGVADRDLLLFRL